MQCCDCDALLNISENMQKLHRKR